MLATLVKWLLFLNLIVASTNVIGKHIYLHNILKVIWSYCSVFELHSIFDQIIYCNKFCLYHTLNGSPWYMYSVFTVVKNGNPKMGIA